MGWFTRFTRFGDAHIVFSQEGDNACGIACVMMCAFKINKLRPGASAVYKEKEIYQIYGKQSGAAYDGSAYTYTNHLASTLNQLGCGKWKTEQIGVNAVPDKIMKVVGKRGLLGPSVDVNPMIVLIGWDKGGAHFVVVDTVRGIGGHQYATINDPWDGDVHVTKIKSGEPLHYVAQQNRTSWEIGEPEHRYQKPSAGGGNGWIIYRS